MTEKPFKLPLSSPSFVRAFPEFIMALNKTMAEEMILSTESNYGQTYSQQQTPYNS